MKFAEVFISYKSEDFDQADWLRKVLETNGISCWMAPASIPGGSSYAKEIPQAIEHCKVMVLVLTQRCQESVWVPKELSSALSAKKTVMPFVLENCALTDDFNFFLSNVQRYEAYQNKVAAAQQMVRDIQALLNARQEPFRSVPLPQQKSASRKSRKKVILGVAVILAVLLVVLLGKFGHGLLPGTDDAVLDPAKLPAESVVSLSGKAESFLCNYGVDWLTVYHENGSSNDLSAEILASCCTDFSLLTDGYSWTDGERNVLILPFVVCLEKVPYEWLDNVYYENPILVDHPALYGFASFPGVGLDKHGDLTISGGYDLTISSLYESQEIMMIEVSNQYPGELFSGELELSNQE
jgi:hypothetical protein